jgi:hypothetical protein
MIRVASLRSILGFLIAPAAGATVIPTWWALHMLPVSSGLVFKAFAAHFMWALWFGYSATIVIGLPLYAVLRIVRWCSPIAFLSASYLVGVAWPVAIFVKNGPPSPYADPLSHYLIWWGGSGFVGGLILWLIDRPDLRVAAADRSTN